MRLLNPNERTYPALIGSSGSCPRGDLSRCIKRRAYSMTSPLRAMSVGGTTRRGSLAVLRLINNSSLVGNSTVE